MGQYYNPTILEKDWKKKSKNTNSVVAASLCCYDFDNGAKLMEHSWVGNNFVGAVAHLLATEFKGYPFVWVGDYADEAEGVDVYRSALNWQRTPEYKNLANKLQEHEKLPTYKYIVNYTKKEYCTIPEDNKDEWQIHPLPILTCSGNGRGGGDFYNKDINDERVGSWAYDRIGVTNNKKEFAGFKEINSHFEEE